MRSPVRGGGEYNAYIQRRYQPSILQQLRANNTLIYTHKLMTEYKQEDQNKSTETKINQSITSRSQGFKFWSMMTS